LIFIQIDLQKLEKKKFDKKFDELKKIGVSNFFCFFFKIYNFLEIFFKFDKKKSLCQLELFGNIFQDFH
jgi:hypothetical protein